jgi:hypothetical protein
VNDRGSGREQWDVEEQGRAVVQVLGTGTGTGTRRRVTDSGNLGAAGVLESLKKTRGLRTQFVHRVDKTRQDQTRQLDGSVLRSGGLRLDCLVAQRVDLGLGGPCHRVVLMLTVLDEALPPASRRKKAMSCKEPLGNGKDRRCSSGSSRVPPEEMEGWI